MIQSISLSDFHSMLPLLRALKRTSAPQERSLGLIGVDKEQNLDV